MNVLFFLEAFQMEELGQLEDPDWLNQLKFLLLVNLIMLLTLLF